MKEPRDVRRRPMRYEERYRLQQERLDAAVRELVEVCGRVDGVRELYVYGSYARGTVGAESDLDVLVVRETRERRVTREDDIRRLLSVSVGFDILVVTLEEFKEKMPQNPIGRHILCEAKLLSNYPQLGR